MARSRLGDLIYYGAVAGAGYIGYKLALRGEFGPAFQSTALDIQAALAGGQQFLSNQQEQAPPANQRQRADPASGAGTVVGGIRIPPGGLDLGAYGVGGLLWDGEAVYTINEGIYIAPAKSLQDAVDRGQEFFATSAAR